MSTEQILINVAPGETRLAFLEKGRLSGLVMAREGQDSLVGNIYLGRVTAVLDGLQAAFVEIGAERAGFLALADLVPHREGKREDLRREQIANHVSEGDAIVVQVLRDPEEDKGAKLTARVSLTGRDVIFSPGQSGFSLSRRISDAAERERLSGLMEKAIPEGASGGFVLRTAAQEAEDEDLEAEVKHMFDDWSNIEAKRKDAEAPALLARELEPAFAALRDFGGVDLEAVHVDDADLFNRLKEFANDNMHDLLELIQLHSGAEPLFEAHGVEEMIDAALDPVVPLPSGGNMIISETPALTAIDVNTGANTGGGREANALNTNEEAAVELANQAQLRNLSGLIIVDFVSMRRRDNQEKLHQTLRKSMGHDPLRPHVVGFTKLGLAEMTRRRRGPSLSEILAGEMPAPIKSAQTVALEVLRTVLKEAAASPSAAFSVKAAPDVIEALGNGCEAGRKEVEAKLGSELVLTADADYRRESYHVEKA
jgi:ribonuclease G